ncbi:MAG: TRAP transporter small permease [Bradyrhizobium sp.]|uniref:TRAP transporter small permease subunit n=1 Tax=Bradyrhizobium sp. TaxID=376 RepID=UPI0027227FE1|nr:TRAP transporter small permease [Bradyrhizobium sp.]MDO8400991.1 TRAP transporter small permease [Bradyrhizobium sp.]
MSIPDPLLPDEPLPQRISRIFAWLAGACILFGCGALISADVVTRFVFKRGMIESFEISGYMLAACIGLGLAFTVTSKSNIRVDILLDAFPYRLRAAGDLLAACALAVIAVALVWFCWKTLAQSWTMNARSTSVMQTPMVLPQAVWWIGLLWFAFMAVLLPLQAILRLLAADQRGFDKLIGSLRVTEEIEQAGIDLAKVAPKTQPNPGATQS